MSEDAPALLPPTHPPRMIERRRTVRDVYDYIIGEILFHMRAEGKSEEELAEVARQIEEERPLFEADYAEKARLRAMVTDDMIREADHLRMMDEDDPVPYRYSRRCSICGVASPSQRAAFHCGHTVCHSCAEENAKSDVTVGKCTICQSTREYVKIFEEEKKNGENDANDNTAASLLFARTCIVCFHKNPRQRAVFTACGHIVCYPCAVHNTISEICRGKCVFCRSASGFVKLIEEKEKEREKEKEMNDVNDEITRMTSSMRISDDNEKN